MRRSKGRRTRNRNYKRAGGRGRAHRATRIKRYGVSRGGIRL